MIADEQYERTVGGGTGGSVTLMGGVLSEEEQAIIAIVDWLQREAWVRGEFPSLEDVRAQVRAMADDERKAYLVAIALTQRPEPVRAGGSITLMGGVGGVSGSGGNGGSVTLTGGSGGAWTP